MKESLQSFLSKRVLSRAAIFLIDIAIILFSCLAVYLVEYGFEGMVREVRYDGLALCLILVAFNSISFAVFRTYRGILRFSSFSDLLRIIFSLMAGYALAGVSILPIRFFVNPEFHVTLIGFMSIFLMNTFLMVFSRILIKEVYDKLQETKEPINVFIYSTKEGGISIAKALRVGDLNYKVHGFISDEEVMVGKELMGLSIYANDENLFRTLEIKDVKTIIISAQKLEEIKNQDKLVSFVDHNISLITTTPAEEWKGESLSREQLKDIEIEDLLPRDPININMKEIASHIEGRNIMVTGAAGSIGSEIVRQVAAFNPGSITLIDQAETPLHNLRLEMLDKWSELNIEIILANVGNYSRLDEIFSITRPDYIFHAAAYKHVPMLELNVSESIQTNVLGTKNVADLALKYNAKKFVMVSTDKAVNPSNVMGCSKRICEIYVQSLARSIDSEGNKRTQFITTRFGNVLGSSGSVIPLFKEQIKNGGPITVTHPEIIRYFMTIPEACQLVLEAGSMGNGGEIYIFDMGKPVKIYELAKRMISLSGARNVKIKFTGLRKGEKLYEELLNTAEHTIPTHHEKIMVAKVREYEYDEVSAQVDNLINISYTYDDMDIVSKMKEIVPEFKSLNSPYEKIDEGIL